jgi:glyoxylase-like metal-dependent hydrolase (beta-lactamase superfamily II)
MVAFVIVCTTAHTDYPVENSCKHAATAVPMPCWPCCCQQCWQVLQLIALTQGVVHAVLQGLGVVRAALSCAGRLPDNVYISHNHTDHAGT